jgi:hypothetical protein
MIWKVRSSALAVLFLSLLFVLPALAGTAPPSPQQVNADIKAKATPDNQGMTGLDKDIGATIRDLDRYMTRALADLKRQTQDAKKKADDAAKAADKAKTAADKCKTAADKTALDALIKDAEKKQKEAQDAKDKKDKTAQDLNNKVDDTVKAVENGMQEMKEQLSKASEKILSDAKAAGLKPEDWSVATPLANIAATQQALDKAVDKANKEGEFKNGKLDTTNEGMKSKLDGTAVKARQAIRKETEASDPSESLKKAKDALDDAKKAAENCPPRVAAGGAKGPAGVKGKQVQETTAFMNTEQGSNVCTDNAEDAKKLGGDVIADGPAGTISHVQDSPQTVEKRAKEKGVKPCWIEINFCVIFTPLTAYRGHDHAAHVDSGRGQHDHDAPDPSWDWGVTPPDTVIRWEAK